MLIPFLPSRHHRSHRRLRAEAYRKLALETLEERVNPSLAFGFAVGGDTSGLSDSTGVAGIAQVTFMSRDILTAPCTSAATR